MRAGPEFQVVAAAAPMYRYLLTAWPVSIPINVLILRYEGYFSQPCHVISRNSAAPEAVRYTEKVGLLHGQY